MLKRILSVVLAAAMLFSFPAFAEEEVATVVPDSGNMQFAKAIGIIGEDAVGGEPVTRLALAKMFCNIIRTDIGLANTVATEFTDVSAEASSAVANVAALRIMNGVGGGLFNPDGHVTYIQALKAIVTFLGYSQNAEDKGGYPFGYYMQAIELDLDENAPADMNEEITFEKAAELFKLALNVDYRRPVDFDPEVNYEVAKGLTYLEYHRDIERVRGIVESNSVTDISGDGLTNYNQIRVNGTVYSYNPAEIDASSLFSYNVDIYCDAEKKEILFIENVGTDVLVIDDSEVAGLNGNVIEYYEDGVKKKKAKISDDTYVIYNGTVCANYTEADINPYIDSYKDGEITAIDNDGDGTYEVISIDAYDTYVVSSVRDDKIFTEYRGGAVLNLNEYEEDDAPLLYNILGEPIKLEEVEIGNTLSVSKDKSGTINRIVVTIDDCVGNVDAIEHRGGKIYITMGGQIFETSNSLILNPQVADADGNIILEIGSRSRLMFNKDGLVSDIEQEEYDSWITGYLTGYKQKSGMDGAYIIRVFGGDGEWSTYELNEKLSINEADSIEASEFGDEAGMVGELIMRQPIIFKTDDDGKVRYVCLQKNMDNTAPLYMYEGFDGSPASEIGIRSTDLSFNGKLLISDSKTIVFSVPAEADRADEDGYAIRTSGIFTATDDTKMPFEAYGTDESPMASIVVLKGYENSRVQPTSQQTTVVDTIETFMDEDGQTAYRMTGYYNKLAVEYIDREEKLLVGPGGTLPERGDILRMTFSGDQPDLVEFVFDASTRQVYDGNGTAANPSNATFTTAQRYSYGKVMRTDDMTFTIRLDNNGVPITEHYNTSKFVIVKVNTQGREMTVSPGSASDLVGENDYPGHGSIVFVHTYSGRARTLVIYED